MKDDLILIVQEIILCCNVICKTNDILPWCQFSSIMWIIDVFNRQQFIEEKGTTPSSRSDSESWAADPDELELVPELPEYAEPIGSNPDPARDQHPDASGVQHTREETLQRGEPQG